MHNRAFTLVELLVVIAVAAVLLGLLLPALGGARVAGRDAKCLATLRDTGLAVRVFIADNKGKLPTEWADFGDGVEPECPADHRAEAYKLGSVPGYTLPLADPQFPTNTAVWDTMRQTKVELALDSEGWHPLTTATAPLKGWGNACYLDGHAERMR